MNLKGTWSLLKPSCSQTGVSREVAGRIAVKSGALRGPQHGEKLDVGAETGLEKQSCESCDVALAKCRTPVSLLILYVSEQQDSGKCHRFEARRPWQVDLGAEA